MKRFQTDRSEYHLREVKSGGLYDIYIVQEPESGRFTVLKKMKQDLYKNDQIFSLFMQEAKLWIDVTRNLYTLASDFIVKAEGFEYINGVPAIRLAFVNGDVLNVYNHIYNSSSEVGSKFCVIGESTPMPFKEKLKLFWQFCVGMIDIDKVIPGFIHCDIKPDNLFVSNGRWVSEKNGWFVRNPYELHHIVISDIGLGRIKTMNADGIDDSDNPFIKKIKLYSQLNPYISPECRENSSAFTIESDIFSFGMVMAEMSIYPHVNEREISNIIKDLSKGINGNKKLISKFDESYSDLDEILSKCLQNDPGKRFSSFRALQESIFELMGSDHPQLGYHMKTQHHLDYVELAEQAFNMGDYERAEDCFNKQIKYSKDSGPSFYAWALANKAAFYLNIEKEEEAANLIVEALNTADDVFFVWYVKGHLLSKKGNFEDAVTCYNKCLDLNPNWELAKGEKEKCKIILQLGFKRGSIGSIT